VLGVLEIVLRHHRVARSLGITRQLDVFFSDMGGVAAHLHIGSIALEIARERIDVLATAIAAARTVLVAVIVVLLVWSHLIASNSEK
jgi:hypothetical protein